MQKVIGRHFDVEDLQKELTPSAREAMLDLVLRWATLDGAVSQFYAALFGLVDEETADEITSERMSVKLRRAEVAMRPVAPELAATLAKLKKQAEKYGKVRDTIAHCHCAGMLKSKPDYLVFLRYRRHVHGGLTVDAVPIEQFVEATRFAEHLRKVVERVDTALRDQGAPR